MRSFWYALLAAVVGAQDPRHEFDPRCPTSVTFDPVGHSRAKSAGSEIAYATVNSSSVEDCATACCRDWCCVSFVFSPPSGLSGAWQEHDSLRGVVGVALSQLSGGGLKAASADPRKALWTQAHGTLSPQEERELVKEIEKCAGERRAVAAARAVKIAKRQRKEI